jgi:hypothetical protein
VNILKNIEILDLKSSSLGDHLFKNSGTAIAPNTRRIDNCEADQAKHQLKQGFIHCIDGTATGGTELIYKTPDLQGFFEEAGEHFTTSLDTH